MKLFINTTSPYARLVRVAIREKGLEGRIEEEVVDPWGGKSDFVSANLHERVPTLLTDEHAGLSETSLILHYIETSKPEPTLYPADDYARMMSSAGVAIGAIDVMAAIIITRLSAPDFDRGKVGLKRFRTVGAAFDRLNEDPPRCLERQVSLAGIATAVAVDYALFRFPEHDWLAERHALRQWRENCRTRASLSSTMPYLPV